MSDKQQLFDETDHHLMQDESPSVYLNSISQNKLFKTEYPFTFLSELKRVAQSKIHHPEGSVWNHTLLVIDHAATRKEQSSNPHVFMWAALLHDIGKKDTTKVRNGKITSYDHEKIGAKQALEFLKTFLTDEDFILKVSRLVRWHMQILYVVKNLPYAEINKMKSQTSVSDIALLGLCDRLGRGLIDQKAQQDEEKAVDMFLEKCNR